MGATCDLTLGTTFRGRDASPAVRNQTTEGYQLEAVGGFDDLSFACQYFSVDRVKTDGEYPGAISSASRPLSDCLRHTQIIWTINFSFHVAYELHHISNTFIGTHMLTCDSWESDSGTLDTKSEHFRQFSRKDVGMWDATTLKQ